MEPRSTRDIEILFKLIVRKQPRSQGPSQGKGNEVDRGSLLVGQGGESSKDEKGGKDRSGDGGKGG